MAARIAYAPQRRHACVTPDANRPGGDDPALFSRPGTVWQCACGSTWVAQPWNPGEMFPRWEREGRVGRWLRERRS